MSEDSTVVTEALFRYVAEHTTPEDDFLQRLKRAAIDAGIPPIWIAAEQGSFMQILLRIAGAREVVEVGTLAGYSAVWMARALPPGGHVRTIEISGRHADFAEKWVAQCDAADRIKIYRGAGRDLLPSFTAGSADAFFMDADKARYPLYLEHALRIVRRGGLIMVDNAFAFGELIEGEPRRRQEVEDVRAFNEIIAGNPELQSIIVPLGDGLWVSVKL